MGLRRPLPKPRRGLAAERTRCWPCARASETHPPRGEICAQRGAWRRGGLDLICITAGRAAGSVAAEGKNGRQGNAGGKVLVYQVMAEWNGRDRASGRARAVKSWLDGAGIASSVCVERYRVDDAAMGLEPAKRVAASRREDAVLILHRDCMPRRAGRYLGKKGGKMLFYGTAPISPSPPRGEGDGPREGEEMARILARYGEGLRVVVHSQRTKGELAGMGCDQESIEVIPVVAEWERLAEMRGDRHLREYLDDGITNLLFCGEIAPQSRLVDLLDIFLAYHRLVNAASRLVLCGTPRLGYLRSLLAEVAERGIDDAVLLLADTRWAEKAACLETAHVFMSPGGGEEAFAEVATALLYSIPVVARENGYLEEYLDGSGIVYGDEDPVLVAELLENVRTDPLLRERVLLAQEKRYAEVGESEMRERFRQALGRIGVD